VHQRSVPDGLAQVNLHRVEAGICGASLAGPRDVLADEDGDFDRSPSLYNSRAVWGEAAATDPTQPHQSALCALEPPWHADDPAVASLRRDKSVAAGVPGRPATRNRNGQCDAHKPAAEAMACSVRRIGSGCPTHLKSHPPRETRAPWSIIPPTLRRRSPFVRSRPRTLAGTTTITVIEEPNRARYEPTSRSTIGGFCRSTQQEANTTSVTLSIWLTSVKHTSVSITDPR